MAYSNQRAVSDGTLELIYISIKFFDQKDISVYLDGVLQTPGVDYTWNTKDSIRMAEPVPAGVEYMLRRRTDISEPRHIFSQGSPFIYETLDQDIEQALFIAQEAIEGGNLSEVFNDLDMHGNRITNVGRAAEPTDAVNLGQVREEIRGGELVSRTLRVPATDSPIPELPNAALRANRVLGFDSRGMPTSFLPASGSAADLQMDLANPAIGGSIVAYDATENAKQAIKSTRDSVAEVAQDLLESKYYKHPTDFGYMVGSDIADLLNTQQVPLDLRGDEFTVSRGVTRTASLRNGKLTYSGGTSTGAFANAILAFTAKPYLDATRMHVKYLGSAPSVIGICAYAGTHRINLRGCFAENTTGQGIRVQGCDMPDLTGCEAADCMRDSIGSRDFNLAYGAIAVFGGSSVCNRAIIRNCSVRGSSTGISIMYGHGHVVSGNDATCTNKMASPELSMGIYCGGLLTNLEISHNRVTNYPLEGIDVHNTGGSQVDGVSGIWIHHNHVRGSGYLGISVISGEAFNIRDATVVDNVVEVDAGTAPLGYGGGIACTRVTSLMLARNRCFMAGVPANASSSFGLQVTSCLNVQSEGSYYRGGWGVYEAYADWAALSVEGTHGEALPAGSEGIRLTQTRATASGQITKLNLVGIAAGSKVLRQVGVPLTIFTLQDNYINGNVDLNVGINDGLVSNNLFRNFSGTLVLGANTLAYNNPGWLGKVAASANPVLGTVKAWLVVREGGTTYHQPLYQPTTL